MEVLSHDVVEDILERVPVKSLLRFKSVSKQWKSTIESNNFQQRQFVHHPQSRVPDVLIMTYPEPNRCEYDDNLGALVTQDIRSSSSVSFSVHDNDTNNDDHIKFISSLITSVKFPIKKGFGFSNSCDGLVCLYNDYENIVVNPTTRWYRKHPPSNLQRRRRSQSVGNQQLGFSKLGFGKDKFNGSYKYVWLYTKTLNLDKKEFNRCEVFDFSINAWRSVTPPSSYDIIAYIKHVYVDGSLHWLTEYESGTEVLSFDLHTETFQVVKTPFDKAEIYQYKMYNLNNRLCLYEINWPNQVMWLFDSGSKTWNHMHTIDLEMTYSWFRKSTAHESKWNDEYIKSFEPMAVLEKKNEKVKVLYCLWINREQARHVVIYDGQTESRDFAFTFHPYGTVSKKKNQISGISYFLFPEFNLYLMN